MKKKLLLLLLSLSSSLFSQNSDPLFQANDRIVFVGNTLIERARLFGHLESAILLSVSPDVKNLSFRNLGWSGDSVFADSRAYFGVPADGRDRLSKNLTEFAPNVILFCYGKEVALSSEQGWTDETADGAATSSGEGLEASKATFLSGYQKLIDITKEATKAQLREIVLISPPPFENLGEPLPDHKINNQNLGAVRDSIRELAAKNDLRFLDLFAAMGGDSYQAEIANPPLTEDGVNHNELGHEKVATEFVKALGYSTNFPDEKNEIYAHFKKSIIEKNRLFFHRWRPANETYLFLFRKHEQGQNAKEIPMFDPLIEKQEQLIEDARIALVSKKSNR